MKRIFYLALLAIAVCFFLVACPNPKLPTVTKVSGPEGAINQASSTFTFSGSSPGGTIVKYEYRKDGGSWTDHGMNTSYTWNGYSQGPHTFEVRVKDSRDAYSSIISWSFTYKSDNLPPIVEKVSGPSGEIDQDSGTFTWSGNDPDGSIVKYEYRKDGGSWFNHGLNTSYTWSGYSEGAHTFEVRAQDNKGAYSNEVKWNFSYKLANPLINGRVVSVIGEFPNIILIGQEGVVVEFSGIGSATTNKFGFYGMEVPYGWSGTVTPVMSQCLFSPPRVSLNNVTSDYSRNFYRFDVLVLVEGGTFMMGDEFGDLWSWCRPVHQVTLTYDFEIGKYEVTFDQYDTFCEATGRSKPDDKGWGRVNRPVINVSWWDAIAYCNWLSVENGLPVAYRLSGEPSAGQMLDANGNVTTDITKVLGYRLPTEAEWEYAARGGKHHSPYRYSGSDNVDEVAWYKGNSGGKTHQVGLILPNALGIYDMSGNVCEWCSDLWYSYTETPKTNPYNTGGSSLRVYRGGSWSDIATYVRVARRDRGAPSSTYYYIGFRITRTVP